MYGYYFFLMLIGLLLPMAMMAEPIDKDAARQKAEAFFGNKTTSTVRRAHIRQDLELVMTNENYHVFNLATDGGFVMVSGDDCTDEIFGLPTAVASMQRICRRTCVSGCRAVTNIGGRNRRKSGQTTKKYMPAYSYYCTE